MNRFALITLIVLSVSFVYMGCDKDKEESTISPYIEGLSIKNFPIIDGSTSTLPLSTVIACELMGLNYQWQENIDGNFKSWSIEPQIGSSLRKKFDNVVKCSQTHNSYINIIDRKVDIVLNARTMSSDEKTYAEEKGVTLIETPIALDALIFIVNPKNPIKELRTEDIHNIYTGKVIDWEELGWSPFPDYFYELYVSTDISPYIRNPNSGSQELMDLLVMKGLEYYTQLPIYDETKLVQGMNQLIDAILKDPFAIGYTVFYYNEQIIRPENSLITIGIDGVHPNKQTISNRSYPYTSEVYAVIRSDTDKSSMAYKIYEWLQTETGKQVISKSEYILN